mgnify:CR=1 FL=1
MVHKDALARAFHEVSRNTPKIVKTTQRKKGAVAGRKQEVAIALSKARHAGAKLPFAGVKRD